MIDAETAFAFFAIDQAIHKIFDVSAGLPHARMGNSRALDADHIIVILHHGPPPVATDIIAEFDAKGAEVIDASHAAVDLGVGVDEAAPLAERNDLVDGYQGSVLHFWYLFCLCHEWFFLST